MDELSRLRRARDRMDRDYAQPLDVPALARIPGSVFKGLAQPVRSGEAAGSRIS